METQTRWEDSKLFPVSSGFLARRSNTPGREHKAADPLQVTVEEFWRTGLMLQEWSQENVFSFFEKEKKAEFANFYLVSLTFIVGCLLQSLSFSLFFLSYSLALWLALYFSLSLWIFRRKNYAL